MLSDLASANYYAAVSGIKRCECLLYCANVFFLVLLELPLPSALPQTVANKSLLYHPRIVTDVQRVLSSRPNAALLQQLCSALRQTNTDHM